jgi:hypothetical protein
MVMSKALLLGAVALAFTAASASAQPDYDYGRSAGQLQYGYGGQAPLYNYGAGAYGNRTAPYVQRAPVRAVPPIRHRHVYH